MVGHACHPGPTVVTFFQLETKVIFFLSLRYILRCSLQAYTLVSNALAIFFFTLLHNFITWCTAVQEKRLYIMLYVNCLHSPIFISVKLIY